ncbi:MAG: Npt1/Npt2 family nucleotide transporter [Myxococcota bacterium]
MRGGLLAVLQNVFKIRPEELKTTGFAFVYLFFAIGAFIIGRITRTVLFLEIPDYKQQLPLAYIGIAISVSAAMYLYSRVQGKLRRDRTNAITLVLLIAGTLSFRFALAGGGEPVLWAFYFWVEVFGTFLVVQFWTMTNEIFHSRQAKRLFALIGGGGVLSNIFIGFFVSGSVRALGTENLLYIISACMAVSLVAVLALGQIARDSLEAARDRTAPVKSRGGAPLPRKKVFATRHVQLIALVVILTYIVSTLVDYQFQAIIGDAIPLKDDRSAYLGNFFAITGIIGGFIQFFITARILERFGLLIALILLPLMMFGGSVGLLAVPFALGAITFTKGSENCLRYTINDSTLQLLYLPLPTALRSRAKATIDGILKPLSIGLAGLLMALLVGRLDTLLGVHIGLSIETEQFGWAVLVGLVGWMTALVGLRREYMKSLLQTLNKRRLNFADANFEITDEQTLETVRQSLESEDIGKVLHALDLVPFVSGKGRDGVHERVMTLLAHEVEDVRVQALRTLRRARAKSIKGAQVTPLLLDDSPQVRAAAVLTLASVTRERAIPEAQALLNDDDLRVRSATVAAFVRYGGLDGVLASAERLKAMLGSEEPRERAEAAWVLGEVGVQTFYQPLLPLLADEDEAVRLAAIRAAGRMRSPELIENLIDGLGRPRLRRATVTALAAFGPQVMDHLVPLLENEATPRTIRAALPRVIAALPANVAVEPLMRFIQDPDAEVRNSVLQGLTLVRDHTPGVRLDDGKVRAALRDEAHAYFQLLAQQVDMNLEEHGALLNDAIAHRQRQTLNRILWALGLRYSLETIRLVAQNLRSTVPRTRANAVEVMDNLLDKREKPLIIPILDDNKPAQTLAAGAEQFSLKRHSRKGWLESFLRGEDPWLQCCAAVAVGDLKIDELAPTVGELVDSENPVCRETAIVVLRDLNRKGLDASLDKLVEDPNEAVSRLARHVRDSQAA